MPMPENGDPIPWFSARTITGDTIDIHVDAGRYVILSFMGEPDNQAGFDKKLGELLCQKSLFNENSMICYGILRAPPPPQSLHWLIKGSQLVFLADYDDKLANLLGVGKKLGAYILDPQLRVVKFIPCDGDANYGLTFGEALRALPPVEDFAGIKIPAPVLIVPNVLDADFCRRLIEYFDSAGGTDSGFLMDRGGITSTVTDYGLKRRSDCLIEDPELAAVFRSRLIKRVVPAIERAFTFKVTRMDRFLLARYSAETNDHFFRHRDNVNAGAQHRRFAMTLNLNAEDYDGGDLRFPEFCSQPYRPPTGAAAIFSCGLLHEVLPITRGDRYVFIAFLYGEEDVLKRRENGKRLAVGERQYMENDRLFPDEELRNDDRAPPASAAAFVAAPDAPAEIDGGEATPSQCSHSVQDLADWVPVQAFVDDTGRPGLTWMDLDGAEFTEPFFGQTIERRQSGDPSVKTKQTGTMDLDDAIDSRPGMFPHGLIFHLSRCGSTLVTQMLKEIDSNLVLSEPTPVNDILGPEWSRLAEPVRHETLERLVQILGRPRTAEQTRSLIKLSSWNTIFFPQLPLSLQDLTKVFVYRDPLEVMVSLLAEPPGWFDLKSSPLEAGWLTGCPASMIGWMSKEEFCARVLARILSSVWNNREKNWLLVNYAELPDAVFNRIAPRFGLPIPNDRKQAMRDVSAIHAKDPSRQRRFSEDSMEKREAASDEIRRLVEDHLTEPYTRLESLRLVQVEMAGTLL